jgi:hypothetical protein
MGGGGGDNEVKETSHEKELARIATEQWARYENTFKPLENKWIADLTSDSANDKANVRGEVAGQIGSQYDTAQQDVDAGNLAAGTNVSSGRFLDSHSRGEDIGKALTRTNLAVDADKTGQLMGAINVGRGQAAEAQASMTDVANTAVRDTIGDSRLEAQSRQDTGSAVSSAAGMLTRGMQDEED